MSFLIILSLPFEEPRWQRDTGRLCAPAARSEVEQETASLFRKQNRSRSVLLTLVTGDRPFQ